jgi:hypothetical protein
MRYANVGARLHRPQAKQRYVELPSELLDHNLDNGKVCLHLSQLTF